MNYNVEHCKPFKSKNNIWMKLEHVGRYIFAKDFLEDKRVNKLADVACGDGYGSNILSHISKHVFSIDRNFTYFNKEYLKNKKIFFQKLNLNDKCEYEKISNQDAVVCFETLEHLEKPKMFLSKIYELLNENGWFILSFPNMRFERFDENGNNKDIFHLHVFEKEKLEKDLKEIGFKIEAVLGQGLCNEMCSANSRLVKNKTLSQKNIDACFNYDETSIMTLARLFAYPNEKDIEESYSFIYVLQK